MNVVNDHFWIMFLDPDYDLSIRYPGFINLQSDNLRMPVERGSDNKLSKVLLKNQHYKWAVDYYKARQQFYGAIYSEGLGVDSIWKGNQPDDQPVLTVFRHFDSASVHRGVLGNLPNTLWVIDYPLLERIYYSLVAGFDVYGNAGHQLSVRLYMDALRIEGESYFLDWDRPLSIGKVHGFYGNFLIAVRALAYILSCGRDGLQRISRAAIVNANYLRVKLQPEYLVPHPERCLHEVVLSADNQLEHGVKALDIAKRLLDLGYHAPTVYFPLIVHEAMMIEPTETESKESIDGFIAAMKQIAREAKEQPELLHEAPTATPVRRLDEALAARKPNIRFMREG